MASIPNAGPSFAAQVEATEEDWATSVPELRSSVRCMLRPGESLMRAQLL